MLGPLEVRAGSGELLEVGGARLRTLLIMLALRPGQLVPASQLIDGLWLLGASVAIRGTQDRSVPDDQRVADGARDALGPATYGEAYRRGREGGLGDWSLPRGAGGMGPPRGRSGGFRGVVPPG